MITRPHPLSIHNGRGLRLAAVHYPADSDAMIVFAHGFCGDKAANGRFRRIAAALQAAGFNCLAFDFAGCGESDDDALNLPKQVEDLDAVLRHARDHGFARLGLYGHSLGGLICLRCWTPDIRAVVLSGPVTGTSEFDWGAFFSKGQLRAMYDDGIGIHHLEEGPRRMVAVERQMIADFENIDQQQVLGAVKCPVLIVHGTVGEDEAVLSATSRKGMACLSPHSRLELIDGADHTFMDHLDLLIARLRQWFVEHFES